MSERVGTGVVPGAGCRKVATNVLDLRVTMSAMFNHSAHSNTGTVVIATSRAIVRDHVCIRASLVLDVSLANTMCHVSVRACCARSEQVGPSTCLGDNRPYTEFNGDNPRIGLYPELLRRGIFVNQEQDLTAGTLAGLHHRSRQDVC